jgi:hypothetical protein
MNLRDMTYSDEWLRMGITRLRWERGIDGIAIWLGVAIGSFAFWACREGAWMGHLSDVVRICGKVAGLGELRVILGIISLREGDLEEGRDAL